MTPLAARFVKRQTLRIKHREPVEQYPEGCLKCLNDFHCFDCSKVIELWEQLKLTDELVQLGAFLPAPRTWIEFKEPGHEPIAYFIAENGVALVDPDNRESAGDALYIAKPGFMMELCAIVPQTRLIIPYQDMQRDWHKINHGKLTYEEQCKLHARNVSAFLCLINSPKIIGRQQFMPNRGLERALTQHFGVGKFPLHAWTEIKLQVAKPPEIDDGEPHEAHLTGRRALHFVRKHLRVRLGQLEYVTSHWRGDPALGIKQQRYQVEP